MDTHAIASAPGVFKNAIDSLLSSLFSWSGKCRAVAPSRREERTLRLRETVSLGERRVIAVVEFCGKRLLVGATAASISLLASEDEVRPDASALDGESRSA